MIFLDGEIHGLCSTDVRAGSFKMYLGIFLIKDTEGVQVVDLGQSTKNFSVADFLNRRSQEGKDVMIFLFEKQVCVTPTI